MIAKIAKTSKTQKSIRIQRIKDNIPKKFFYEDCFTTTARNKILLDLPLDYSKVEYGNMLACSPLLSKEQEYHFFRKYNYLRYKLIKSTVGFGSSDVKPHPRPCKPVKLEQLGEKSLTEIESLICQIQQIRNLLLQSNLRLIVKQLSKHYPKDCVDRDDFFSHGYCHVLKAIECFDYRRGFKFSTYCINALQFNFNRDRFNKNKLDNFFTTIEYDGDSFDTEDKKEQSYSEINQSYNKKFINQVLNKLKGNFKNPEVKIKVIRDYYGLDGVQKNLYQIADELKLSKERIRQIKLSAMKYLSNKASKELVYDPLV